MKKKIFTMLPGLAISLFVLAGCKSREPAREPAKDTSKESSKEPSKQIEPEVARKAPDFSPLQKYASREKITKLFE